MQKRGIIFGSYSTGAQGWTLTGWNFSRAVQKTNYVDKPGGDGSWDLSDALSDGIPRYNDRTLTATFEISQGDRMQREYTIRQMVNMLDGKRMKIYLPDDDTHYIEGRVHVVREYNDLAHGAVTVTATCSPWKYDRDETTFTAKLSATVNSLRIVNAGRLAVVPVITVNTTNTAGVVITYGNASATFQAGTHKWPALLLTPEEDHIVTFSGTNGDVISFTFRRGVLE
jgi:hypothetical protein